MKKLYYFSSGPRERVLKKILSCGWQVEKLFLTSIEETPQLKETFEIAQQFNLPVKFLNKNDLDSLYLNLDPAIPCFSLGFKYLFPIEFVSHFDLMLNVHGTLLPHYGGARTLNWIIENGEDFSGVTVHKIDPGMDTGPILHQEVFPVSPFDTGKSLYRKTLDFEPKVVELCLKKIKKNNLNFIQQSGNKVKQYPNRVPDHSHLNAKKPLECLINKIRAADPDRYPAYFYYNGEKVGIKLFRIKKNQNESDMI